MVRAGEESGTLEAVLAGLPITVKASAFLPSYRAGVHCAYPLIMIVVSIAILVFL